jgi:hypothetical protein
MKNFNHHLKKQEERDEETDSRLVLYNRKLFKLVNNDEEGLCLFYSVSSFLTELHHKKNLLFLVSGHHVSTGPILRHLVIQMPFGIWLSFFAQYLRWTLMCLRNIMVILRMMMRKRQSTAA